MNSTAPKIDNRDQKGIASKVREYIVRFLPAAWSNTDAVSSDTGLDSIVQLFARLVEIVNQSLNKVADKHYLSFLEMLGLDPAPPEAARTDLLFTTVPGATESVLIPVGTQVAREGGGSDPIVFETEEDLDVLPFGISGVFSSSPLEDSYSDCSYIAGENKNDTLARMFTGNDPVRHRIYFGHGKLLSYDESVNVRLNLVMREDLILPEENWSVKWFYHSDDQEEPMEITEVININDPSDTEVIQLLKSGTIEFQNIKGIGTKKIGGYKNSKVNGVWEPVEKENHWIFAELQVPLYGEITLPEIDQAELAVSFQGEEKKVDRAVFNRQNLDVSLDFYPFGKKPEFNDTFYFSSESGFSEQGAMVSMKVELSRAGSPDPVGTEIRLRYEYWDGSDWMLLGEASSLTGGSGGEFQFADETLAYTRLSADGTGEIPVIRFVCPNIASVKVNGKSGRWIRARLLGGNYGKEAYLVGTGYHAASFSPPVIATLKISKASSYEMNTDLPEGIIAENDFFYEDYSSLNQYNHENPDVQQLDENHKRNYIVPFTASEQGNPAFYLSFDGEIANHTVNMLISLPGGTLNSFQMIDLNDYPLLVWETWSSEGWIALGATDNTELFTQRDGVTLVVSGTAQKRPLFGKMASWVRVRLAQGDYKIYPELDRIYLNTVKASHRISVSDELLGSSNGEPNQVFSLSKLPVLDGQKIVVVEKSISADDRKVLESEEGSDAVEDTLDAAGKIVESRVRWHEVTRFDFSSASSRHYRIDRASGEILFGDGKRGMIPPPGKSNIVCEFYQYGGGYRGNVDAGSLTRIRNSIPKIKSVTNPISVDGGVDIQDLDDLRETGPSRIKSRNRAVTVSDYETLVSRSTGEIARVRCLPTTNGNFEKQAGYVLIIIIPEKGVEVLKPVPSPELMQFVDDYLSTRAATEIINSSNQQVNVVGPSYLKVGLNTIIHTLTDQEARVVQNRVRDRLDTYFHALLGGDDGNGWEFGRNVYLSEIYAVLENVEGVDYVESITLNGARQIKRLIPANSFFVPSQFDADSLITISGYRNVNDTLVTSTDVPVEMSMELAEDIPEDTGITEFFAKGFQEDQVITVSLPGVSDDNASFSPLIAGIEYTTEYSVKKRLLKLTQSYIAGRDFPAGETIVTAKNGRVKTTLIRSINSGDEVKELLIAEPDYGDSYLIHNNRSIRNNKKGVLQGSVDYNRKIYLDPNYLVYSGSHEIIIK